jgi:uncharacterized protein
MYHLAAGSGCSVSPFPEERFLDPDFFGPGFLGVPDVDALVFTGLALSAFCTSFVGAVTGTLGGLLLLGIMALVFPPAVLIPVHTVVQLGASCSRVILMWKWLMRDTLPPFFIGAVIGATAGAQVFVVLSNAWLQVVIGGFIIVFTWMPKFASAGADRYRFAAAGFITTFVGMFVSATGTMLSPIVASVAPDRRNHVATFTSMMSMVHLTKLVAFFALGVAVADYTALMIAMVATASCGNWCGKHVLDRIPETGFWIIFKIILTALGFRLLWAGARDGGLI